MDDEINRWQCPKCFSRDLNVEVRMSARLLQHEDGSETIDDDANSSHEWDSDSKMWCRNCSHEAIADLFDVRTAMLMRRLRDEEAIAEHTVNLHMDTLDLSRVISHCGVDVDPDSDNLLSTLTDSQVFAVRAYMDAILLIIPAAVAAPRSTSDTEFRICIDNMSRSESLTPYQRAALAHALDLMESIDVDTNRASIANVWVTGHVSAATLLALGYNLEGAKR